ncbi:hypothetical protein [Mycobacterium paragordonae]|uniref:hypothetical protein n=1 Tax=Mycobacterium paragordonae TaxID=1389713 RepID=UPI0039859EDC
MMTTHCCIAGTECCRAQTANGTRAGALTEKPHTLCPACRKRIQSAAQQLPRDWFNLYRALGEHAALTGQRIRSTPTPAIPISTRKESLMRAIVDMADRAAAMVSNARNIKQPVSYKGRGYPTQPEHTLRASIELVEPHIDVLASAPTEPAVIWAKPRRCDHHADLIGQAEAIGIDPAPAYEMAGDCDECNGWGEHGQERRLVEMSGLEVAIELVELHNQTRAELGLTRLREEYTMPCPDCGSRVYRNDGESIVICEGNAKHTCTEREYKVRAGLLLEEEGYKQMAEYLLAEAYWRLDRMQKLIENMAKDPDIALPGAGALVLEKLQSILTEGADVDGKPIGHQRPEQRASGTDQKAALQRQVDEDNWTWRKEPRYQPPKRKPRKANRPTGPAIAASSLLTIVDTDQDAALNGHLKCAKPGCNMVHAGECP